MRVLIAIGCNRYDHLSQLKSAEEDGSRFFGRLVTETADYSPHRSRLLLSPALDEVLAAFDALLSEPEPPDVLTIFFAGHGLTTASGHFICLRDAHSGRLTTTALSVSTVLAIVAELKPSQVYILLDSCESAGAMFDLWGILKQEVLGRRGGLSVSFLVAAASDEVALEEERTGGRATAQILRVLNGEIRVQAARPFLDLVEVGRSVSMELGAGGQTAVTWGLHLYGEGRFARNPHYVDLPNGQRPPGVLILPGSAKADRIAARSDDLWRLYLSASEELLPRTLLERLLDISGEAGLTFGEKTSFVLGIANSLGDRAARLSVDVLAEFELMAACGLALLSDADEGEFEQVVATVSDSLGRAANAAVHSIRLSIRTDRNFLLSPGAGILNNLYYLPLRISKLLGFLGLLRHGGFLADADAVTEIVESLYGQYRGSMVAVEDTQGGHLYLYFSSHGETNGGGREVEIYRRYLDSYVEVAGKLAREGLLAKDRVRYLLARHVEQIPEELCQRPSTFLATLIACARAADCVESVDRLMIAVDHHVVGLFVPTDYREFAAKTIREGVNRIYAVGRDFWSVGEFEQLLERDIAPAVQRDSRIGRRGVWILCLAASWLFPNRLPLFIPCAGERAGWQERPR